nr:MAG TPA: hypothetical protein [Caudoviricetes sp.]
MHPKKFHPTAQSAQKGPVRLITLTSFLNKWLSRLRKAQ